MEVLEDTNDESTKTFALDLIKKSATQASAKLQFCRLAFGAAGSAGAEIDLGDAEGVARGFIEAMGGTISAANRIDRGGAVFTLEMPVPINRKPIGPTP